MKEKQEEFLKHYEPVHERFERFCRARVFGDLDFRDVMNDTLLIAYQKFDELQAKEAFASFLFGICVRVLGNKYQKKREQRLPENHSFHQLKDHGTSPTSSADVHYLYQAMKQLPEEQREALLLFEISGFSIREIAELQHASESAVKQRLKRGREKLAEWLTFDALEQQKTVEHG